MAQEQERDFEEREIAVAFYKSQIQKTEINMNGLLHHLLLQTQGGQLYPGKIPVGRMERVLDLGCGNGEWVLELSRRLPLLQIFGADSDEDALHQARVQCNAGNFRQANFRKFELTGDLPVPNEYLDMVHLSRCGRFILPGGLPVFLSECVRILRPGGWLVASDLEICELSSQAFIKLYRALLQIQADLALSLDRTGTTVGIAAQLYPLLIQVRLEQVSYELHTIDLGYMGGSYAQSFLFEILTMANALKRLIVGMGIFDSRTFDALIEQGESELRGEELCGWGMVVTAYGQKGDA